MSVATPTKLDAVAYFESKLEFEAGPYSLKLLMDNKEPLTVLDLRTEDAYTAGHIPGAINARMEDLEKSTDSLDKSKTIVVYCYNITCLLSTRAALHLAKKGFKVKELYGGYQEWTNNKMEVETKHSTEANVCSSTKSCG